MLRSLSVVRDVCVIRYEPIQMFATLYIFALLTVNSEHTKTHQTRGLVRNVTYFFLLVHNDIVAH